MSRARGRTADSPAKRLLRRVLLGAAAVAVIAFAVEGGEYGTSDIYVQKGRKARLRAEVDGLRADIESLRVEVKSVSTDNSRLERIARERFGMVKGDKELLYWTTRDNDASGNRLPVTARDSIVARDTSGVRPRG